MLNIKRQFMILVKHGFLVNLKDSKQVTTIKVDHV